MKKIWFAFVAIAILSFVAFAETQESDSVQNNEFLLKANELRALATESYENGDYDGAANYAAQAQEYNTLSDQYVDKMLSKSAAIKTMERASQRIEQARVIKAEVSYPDAWSKASTEMEVANATYNAENYDEAKLHAETVIAALQGIAEKPPLPEFYIVRLIPTKRDCFWNIAGYPFVYNDPTKWTKLYEANRNKLVDPQNPGLIHPGLKLVIPALRGETRSGTYDSTKTYESLDTVAPKPKTIK